MSGVEVVGLLLGAFPLMISSMEHWETTKKLTTTWLRVKRAHRNDLRRLRVCELRFRLHMRDLLEPLVVDETVSPAQYQQMLANTQDAIWNEATVQDALLDRLAETRDTYIDTLRCMAETIMKLAKMTMVDDEKFQASLKDQKKLLDPSTLRANNAIVVELKRLSYAFGMFKREKLLVEIEELSETLASFLSTTDKIVDRNTSNELGKSRRAARKYKMLLSFSSHAGSIFHLLNDAWKCPCVTQHCANVWLQNEASHAKIELEMLLRSSTGPATSIGGPWTRQPLRVGLQEAKPLQRPGERTVRWQEPSANVPPPITPIADVIHSHGLCKLTSSSCQAHTCLGLLTDGKTGDTYHLYDVSQSHEYSQLVSLADVLGRRVPASLFRIGRWTIAYSLACSFVRLATTPWLPQPAQDLLQVLVPLDPDHNDRVLYERAYVVSRFGPARPVQPPPGTVLPSAELTDAAFVELGILLLELCFTRLISEHAKWEDPEVKLLPPANPFVRKMVASEWAKDVQWEADRDYAEAVDWCLHRATTKSDKWREQMVEHVVQPLQRCCEAAETAAGVMR